MPGYTLRQLAYFVAVAEAGSISAAAVKLHVTPTAVASALTDLERVLRTQLMVRRKAHGVVLTPTGTFLSERASALLRDADELELAAAGGGTELAGPLFLGCYVTIAPTIVPTLMEWIATNHPKVELTVVTGSQDELPRQLVAGALDLAIGYDIALPDGLDSVLLYRAPAHVLLPNGHPAADRDVVPMAELADEPMILLEIPPAAQHTLLPRALVATVGKGGQIRLRRRPIQSAQQVSLSGSSQVVVVTGDHVLGSDRLPVRTNDCLNVPTEGPVLPEYQEWIVVPFALVVVPPSRPAGSWRS